MEENILNPSAWLGMGPIGAILFILLVFVWTYMKNTQKTSSNDIQVLASKIDKLADSNLEMVKTLATTLTQWNIEQRSNTNALSELSRGNSEHAAKLDRIEGKLDTLVNLKCKVQES